MMQETMEKRVNRTVGKSRQKDFFAVLLFFFLLPYTCSSVVRAGQEKTVETIVPVSGRTVRMQSGSDVRTMTEEAQQLCRGRASGGDRVGEWHDRSSAGEHLSK